MMNEELKAKIGKEVMEEERLGGGSNWAMTEKIRFEVEIAE